VVRPAHGMPVRIGDRKDVQVAYSRRGSSRTRSRSRGTSRSSSRSSYRSRGSRPPSRRRASARRAPARSQTIRIEVVPAQLSDVARPQIGMKPAAAPKKAMF